MCHIKALSITERRMTMSEKRKDNKGRILRTRESQRKDNPETAWWRNWLCRRKDYRDCPIRARIHRFPILRPYVPSHILYQYVKCGHGYQELARISRFKDLWKDIFKMIKILFVCHGKTAKDRKKCWKTGGFLGLVGKVHLCFTYLYSANKVREKNWCWIWEGHE